ncbi:hypothetical protein [Rhizosphaericola mali]|uniref:Uncharacterized protein n=1 Tax=Rhizosphaericola mali TaxID=2545455 RepID=A0A5P2G534_9BACT|nr:hypothetical protein [Rhizosphaericola mali]QES88932.1 hypothetical protein E0W69_009770 [Rhizosphaericola mali]
MQQDKYIKNLLEQLNSGKTLNSYFVTRKLSESILLARIWSIEENEPPTDIYLLKDKESYIGAIQEQETELYAYTTPLSRRKGCMKTALKETVLPHLLQRTPILRGTISRSLLSEKMYIAGKHLAITVGFEMLKEENGQCRLLLDGTKLQKRIFIQGENVTLSHEEKTTMKRLIHKSTLYTSIAQCMMEYREGRNSLSEDLLDVYSQMKVLYEKV